MTNNFNGGFNQQQQQSGFQAQPQGGFNPNSNTNNTNTNDNKGALNNHAKIQIVANLTKDPETRAVGNNGAKVASASVAINHKGQNAATDFWDVEVWVNQGNSSATHDFLMDYCQKGRQVFIEGVPHLKRRKRQINGQDVLDQNGKAVYDSYPAIRVNTLLGLGGGQKNEGGGQAPATQQGSFNQQAQQQQQQQPGAFNQQPQGGFQQPGQPQGGFGQPQGGFAPQGNFGAPAGGAPVGGQFGAPAGQFPNNG